MSHKYAFMYILYILQVGKSFSTPLEISLKNHVKPLFVDWFEF